MYNDIVGSLLNFLNTKSLELGFLMLQTSLEKPIINNKFNKLFSV